MNFDDIGYKPKIISTIVDVFDPFGGIGTAISQK